MKNDLGFAAELEIDRCHRVKCCNQSDQEQRRPGTIICQFDKFKDKQKILNNAKKLRGKTVISCKNYHFFLRRFFKRKHVDLQKNLWQKVLQYWRQKKIACLSYRSIIVVKFERMLVLNKWGSGSQELLSKISPELSEGWYFIKYHPSESSGDVLPNDSFNPNRHFFNTNIQNINTPYILPEEF